MRSLLYSIKREFLGAIKGVSKWLDVDEESMREDDEEDDEWLEPGSWMRQECHGEEEESTENDEIGRKPASSICKVPGTIYVGEGHGLNDMVVVRHVPTLGSNS